MEVMLYWIAPSLAGFTETHVTQEVEDHELYISGYACVRGNSCDRNWWAITIKVAEVNLRDSIMLIYHSPSCSDAAFIEYLEESCDRALMSDSFIVTGDFNIDMKVQDYT